MKTVFEIPYVKKQFDNNLRWQKVLRIFVIAYKTFTLDLF